ncbi:hypothetical protein HAX54_026153, partial [Datura stramonium]|nr:hypothetical protein [Datura stramonium]
MVVRLMVAAGARKNKREGRRSGGFWLDGEEERVWRWFRISPEAAGKRERRGLVSVNGEELSKGEAKCEKRRAAAAE